MKRLRELDAQTPLIAKAQRLLESVEPLHDDEPRMRRVRAQLDRPRPGFSWARLPAFGVVAVLLLFGGSAFAALRLFEASRTHKSAPLPRPAAKHTPLIAPRLAAQSGAPEQDDPAMTPADVPAQHVSPKPQNRVRQSAPPLRAQPTAKAHEPTHDAGATAARSSGSRATGLGTSSARPAAKPPSKAEPQPIAADDAAPSSTQPPASDSELVHRALRALRRDGDPALAARLLERQQTLHGDGPLAQETLALQIEASLALHDGHARGFARRYLERYPSGQYRGVARRALEESGP